MSAVVQGRPTRTAIRVEFIAYGTARYCPGVVCDNDHGARHDAFGDERRLLAWELNRFLDKRLPYCGQCDEFLLAPPGWRAE